MSEPITVQIADATFAQLRDFAVENGLDYKIGMNTATLRSNIMAAFPEQTEITIEAPQGTAPTTQAAPVVKADPEPQTTAGAQEEPAAAAPVSTHYNNDPKVEIKIPSTKEPGGSRDVPVSVNGETVLIKRDIKVKIPLRFYYSLEAALEKHYKYEENEANNQMEMVERETNAYEFSTYSMPTDEEIAEWEARVSGSFAP